MCWTRTHREQEMQAIERYRITRYQRRQLTVGPIGVGSGLPDQSKLLLLLECGCLEVPLWSRRQAHGKMQEEGPWILSLEVPVPFIKGGGALVGGNCTKNALPILSS